MNYVNFLQKPLFNQNQFFIKHSVQLAILKTFFIFLKEKMAGTQVS